MNYKRFALPLVGLIFLSMATACAPAPNSWLLGNEYVGERSVMYILVPKEESLEAKVVKVATGVAQPNVPDFHIRVCNVTATGAEEECNQTLVLQNVQP